MTTKKLQLDCFFLKSVGHSEIYKKWEVGVKIWRVTSRLGDMASMLVNDFTILAGCWLCHTLNTENLPANLTSSTETLSVMFSASFLYKLSTLFTILLHCHLLVVIEKLIMRLKIKTHINQA